MRGPCHENPRKMIIQRQARLAALFLPGSLFLFAIPRTNAVQTIKKPVAQTLTTAASSVLSGTEPQSPSGSQGHGASEQKQNASLVVVVNDEVGLAIRFAQVTLSVPNKPSLIKEETDYAGRCQFRNLSPGTYQLTVEKEGFYAVKSRNIQAAGETSTEVTLNHVREFSEKLNVTASPATIEPGETASTHALNDREIIDLPFNVPRDIRYALPLLPGVVQDATAQVHVNGSATSQILDQLDSFNITDPASGFFDARVPVSALRSATVFSARSPAQYGKASGGVLDLTTGMGDDHYRFDATDFLPSISTNRGFHINTWTPRGSISGPIKKGKAWFLLAPEGEYHLNIVTDLPPGSDQNSRWRFGDLAKAQVNLTSSNILTANFLVNEFHNTHAGLSRFNPVEATTNQSESINHVSVKDQSILSNGALLEYGIAFSRFYAATNPLGNQTFVMTPDTTSGNYFEQAAARSERTQIIANIVAPTVRKGGSHEFRGGIDLDRLADVESFNRHNIQIFREDGTLSRTVTFPGSANLSQTNSEVGVYGQDHWSVFNRLFLDPGVRFDWDSILPGGRISPRLAGSFLPTASGNTKITAGAGIYYDASNLGLYTEPEEGTRIDTFYDQTGQTLLIPPVQSIFQIDRRNLKAPWFFNWSAGIERKLPASVLLRMEFIEKRGHHGWTYVNPCAGPYGCFDGKFLMESSEQDHYDAWQVSVRRQFSGGHVFFASYTHSVARSNAVLNFNVENPFFSPQAGGRLPWDVPNRVVGWGILPLVKGFDLAYTLDWHDGFPFGLVNENQELIGAPDRMRFPTFFSLNMALEKRITLFGFQWEVRAGFDNITDRANPAVVDNNIDSPTFLTFGSSDNRSLTGQVRLLGRK